jgi:tetratricopeptide (TPR) repeat protein
MNQLASPEKEQKMINYLDKGAELLADGKLEEAKEVYLEAIEVITDSAEIYQKLGDSCLKLKQWQDAVVYYQKALELNPDNYWTYYSLAQALIEQNQYREAVKVAQKAIAIEAELPLAYRQLGTIYLELQQWQKVIEVLEKAIALEPNFSWVYYDLGKALIHEHLWQKALICYQKFIELEANFWEGYFRLGEVYEKLKQQDKAVEAYLQSIKLNPDFAWHYYYLADILFSQRSWQAAANNYQKAIEIEPKIWEASQKLGEALLHLEKWEQAAAVLEQGIKVNSYSSYLHYNLGLALTKLERKEAAINCFHQAIALNSTYTLTYVKLVEILIEQQQWTEAQKWLQQGNSNCFEHLDLLNEQAKKVNEISSYSYKSLSFSLVSDATTYKTRDNKIADEKFKLAEVFSNRGDWKQAAKTYAKAIEYNPDNSWYFCCLGIALEQQQEYEDAITAYNRAIELDAKSAWYYKCLGGLFFKQQQWEQAVSCYQKALEIKPDDFWYCENIGIALFHLERWEQAEQMLQRAIELHPYDVEIQDKLAKTLLRQAKWSEAQTVSHNALKLIPDRFELYNNSIQALKKLGKEEAAIELGERQKLYQKIVSFKAKIKLNPTKIDYYQDLAQALEKLGKWAAVAGTYRFCTQANPDNPWWLYASWGKALLKVGQPKEAESVYRRAMELNTKENSWLTQGFVEALFKVGKWSEVITTCSNSGEARLDLPKSFDYWGRALCKLKQWSEAVIVYHSAIEKFTNKVWWKAKFYSHLGNIYHRQQNWQQAQQAYQQSLQLNSNEFSHYNNLGDTFFHQDKWDEAVAYYRQALIQNSHLSWSDRLSFVGWSYHQLGDSLLTQEKYAEAETAYNKAIQLNRDSPWHYLRLATALAKQNQWQSAYQALVEGKQLQTTPSQDMPNADDVLTQMSERGLVICIYTCKQNQHKQKAIRDTWLKKVIQHNIPYFFVIGKPSSQSYLEKDILYVDAPDDYEHLPQKTYKLFKYIYNQTFYSHAFKIDDDCYLNVEALLEIEFSDRDYMGKVLHNAQNLLKNRDRDKINLTQYRGQYKGSWADGSSGYLLNRYAMQQLVRYLEPEISTEIYEDKLVGDLLRESNIVPSCPDEYVVGVERCDSSTAHKLAFQPRSEADYPHISNNTVVFHSDASPGIFYQIDRQFNREHNAFNKNFLRNFYWFDNEQSHICLERKDDKEIELAADDILCFIVERNESLRLPYILSYYREKGVNKFFVVDNHSTNETLSYLLEQPDVYVWHTSRSYAGAKWGVDWVEILLQNYGFNHWCVLIDADELLYYPDCETKNIRQLCQELDREGNQAFSTVLLDMYSQKPLREANYQSGQNFLEVCSHFDKKFYTAKALNGGPENNITAYFGGLRQRIFGGESMSFCINKAPLIKYDYNVRLYEGFHWIGNVKLASETGCLLHFKYFSTFHEYAKQEAQRGEHWNGGSEYLKYARKLEENPQLSFWDSELSVKLESSQTLLDFGAIKKPSQFDRS